MLECKMILNHNVELQHSRILPSHGEANIWLCVKHTLLKPKWGLFKRTNGHSAC